MKAVLCQGISPYIAPVPTFAVPRQTPLCPVPPMVNGNLPLDGGALKVSESELPEFADCPWLKRLVGSREFLYGRKLYALWLVGVQQEEIERHPAVLERIERCRRNRKRMKTGLLSAPDPRLFRDLKNPDRCIAVPAMCSPSRSLIPAGWLDGSSIATQQMYIVPDAEMYHFGIMSSTMHSEWIKAVCGRLQTTVRYSMAIGYNAFPWPKASGEQKEETAALAEDILRARDGHPEMHLAAMYSPKTAPKELTTAQKRLDRMVDALYGLTEPSSLDRIRALFQAYEKAAQGRQFSIDSF